MEDYLRPISYKILNSTNDEVLFENTIPLMFFSLAFDIYGIPGKVSNTSIEFNIDDGFSLKVDSLN